MGSYSNRAAMIAKWAALEATYPTLCVSENLGHSVEARDILLYKIGNPLGGRLALVAGLHGEEVPSQEIVYQFALWVLSSSDADAVRIRTRNYLLIIPMLCLDEYDVASTNHAGVNLYYNFDYDFGSAGTGYGEAPLWQYRGPSALSEPESVILKRFFMTWLPRIELACHDGTSTKAFYAPGGADQADLDYLEGLHTKYLKKARELNALDLLFTFVENTTGGGRPEACAYYHTDKWVLGTLCEFCVNTVTYDDCVATWWPNAKPLLVVLAQAVEEFADPQENPASEFTFGSVEVPDEDVVEADVDLRSTEAMGTFNALLQNWDAKYSPGGTYPLTKGLAATLKIGRGSVIPQLMVGRIEKVRGVEKADGKHYLSVFGRSTFEHNLRLSVDDTFVDTRAELLVEHLIEEFTDLEHLINDAADQTPAFSDCTVVDPNGRFTATNHRIYINDLHRNEDAYVHKDFGVDGLSDFEFWLDIRQADAGDNWGGAYFGVCTTDLDDFYGLITGSKTAVGIFVETDNATPRTMEVRLREAYAGSSYDSSHIHFTMGKVLFCIFRKIETDLWLEIYDDAERTNLNTILQLTLQQYHSFRYFMPVCSNNTASGEHFDGYVSEASFIEPTDTIFARTEYDDTPVNDALLDAAKASDINGVIGFEIRTTTEGKFQFYPVGAKVRNDLDITEILEAAEWEDDITRVRNKIKVYGAYFKHYPDDLTSWATSLTGWTATSGVNLQLDTSIKRSGHASSIYIATPGGGGTINLYRTFDALRKYQKFVSWLRIPGNLGGGTFYIRLLAPDDSNYFQADIKTFVEASCILQFGFLELPMGPNQIYDADNSPNGIWTEVGAPNWRKVEGLRYVMTCPGSTSYLNVDSDIGFLLGPYTALSEDAASQAAYDTRETSFTFPDLFSDAECTRRADALLAWLAESLQSTVAETDVLVFQDRPLLAGDTLHHHISNLNVDGDFRVNRALYQLRSENGKSLKVIMELGNQPQLMADWLAALKRKVRSQGSYAGPPY